MHTYSRSSANERTILVYNVFFLTVIDLPARLGYHKFGTHFFRRTRHRRKLGMDLPVDLSKLLFQELFCYQPQHDFNCRVPTKTTPTLTPVTPTTLRNFEPTILDYQAETHQNEAGFVPPLLQTIGSSLLSSANVSVSASIPDNAGCGGNLYVSVKSWQGGGNTTTEIPSLISLNTNTLSPPIPTHIISMESASSSSSSSSSSGRSRRNTGGRRPNKENGISPEEEKKKMIRRERNKVAAAKCRKKRVEQIQSLELKVRDEEEKRNGLSHQNQQLENKIEDLRAVFESHLPHCRIRDTDSPEDIKPYHLIAENHLQHHHQQQQQQQQLQHHQHQHQHQHLQHHHLEALRDEKPSLSQISIDPSGMYTNETLIIPDKTVMDTSCSATVVVTSCSGITSTGSALKQRPNCLPLSTTSSSSSSFVVRNKNTIAEVTGLPMTTPSAEFLDSLIQSGTGLTPITSGIVPSCSTQLRNSNSNNIVDIASPDSMPTKLVSL